MMKCQLQSKLRPGTGTLPCRSAAPVSKRFMKIRSVYEAPSTISAASELKLIQRYSDVVPDSLLGRSIEKPKAATVSYSVLSGIVASESLGLRPYENAIVSAMNFDRCREMTGEKRAHCQLSKALVNVGTMFAKEVEGRVCTEVDARLANDTAKMVSSVEELCQLYKEAGVPVSKLIFRLPATWAGIKAAKQLEAKSIPTQVFFVFSMVQGVAAAQAGVSVLQPNVGRTREWYKKNPGVIRDPHGPRQDAGGASDYDPGVMLVQQIYNYTKQFHPKTKIMASGIRSKEDAMALCGVDYLVIPSKVIAELAAMPTAAGYNDGMHQMGTVDEGMQVALSIESAYESGVEKMPDIDEQAFSNGLGIAGAELLQMGLKQQVEQADHIMPYFMKNVTSSSSL